MSGWLFDELAPAPSAATPAEGATPSERRAPDDAAPSRPKGAGPDDAASIEQRAAAAEGAASSSHEGRAAAAEDGPVEPDRHGAARRAQPPEVLHDATPAPDPARERRALADLRAALEAELEAPVDVSFGDSRTRPVVLRPPTAVELRRAPRLRKGLVVRLHRAFAGAPPEVGRALARWARVGRRARRACRELDDWLARALAELPPPAARRAATHEPRGRAHDLAGLAEELRREQFPADFPAPADLPAIGWGARRRSRARRSLRLGSYHPEGRVVRLHPVLDHADVPRWFVRYVLFHELLHAALPWDGRGRGARHHGPAFRAREARYPDLARALAWERAHVGALIRRARRGG